MNDSIAAVFSWNLLLFALGVFVMTWVIRTVVEYFIPKAVDAKLWQKLVLPLLPVVLGTAIGFFAKMYPYPDGLTTLVARLMFGGVGGMFSGLVFQIAKGMLKDRIQAFVGNK
jgi:hypothetical protein